jgi:hypothetical protein
MTTLTNFTPSPTSNFQFTPTLDGAQYTAIIRWNLFGERYYMKLTTLDGILVANVPLVGSPPGYDINLVAGYFSSSLVFRAINNQFEVSP